MTVGKGTKSGKDLIGLIDEIELMRGRIKELQDAEKEIFARGKSMGFDLKVLRGMLALRKQDKAERQTYQHLVDIYMHAIGEEDETPLFVALSAVGVDMAAREQAVEFLKSIVPPSGELVMKIGGKQIRVFRDGDGRPRAEDVIDAPEPSVKKPRPKREPATITPIKSAADRAEEMWKKKQKGTASDDPLPSPPGPPEPETPSP